MKNREKCVLCVTLRLGSSVSKGREKVREKKDEKTSPSKKTNTRMTEKEEECPNKKRGEKWRKRNDKKDTNAKKSKEKGAKTV